MDDVRIAQHSSDELELASPGIRVYTNELSALLDRHRNELVVRELTQWGDATPNNILGRVLSPYYDLIGTLSSLAIFHEQEPGFRTIGLGQCGVVLERPGRNYVLKIPKDSHQDALWADFVAHREVERALRAQAQEPVCRVPRVFGYVHKTNEAWWNENHPLLSEIHQSISVPAMVLITEHIPPLPEVARQVLIHRWCPETSRLEVSANPANQDCLARVFLGYRRPENAPLARNFTLRNFNLCLDQMLEIGLLVESFATAMAEALAIIHWEAKVDAYGIEFVLGSEAQMTDDDTPPSRALEIPLIDLPPHTDIESPLDTDPEALMCVNFQARFSRLWILDFNRCTTFSEQDMIERPDSVLTHLVDAFFDNDPYYPLPLMELDIDQEMWKAFCTAYLRKAKEILTGQDPQLVSLPERFIDLCVARERANLSKGLGHGHRGCSDIPGKT